MKQRVERGAIENRVRCIAGGLVLMLLQGCTANVIEGTVYNVQGEGLPGVAVQVENARHQAMSNALGNYRIRYDVGHVALQFSKTGYTPARLELEVDSARAIPADEVTLWNLPANRGVFLYENYRHTPCKRTVPKDFDTELAGRVLGTDIWADVVTTDLRPMILCYGKVPRYNVYLTLLELTEVKITDASIQTETTEALIPRSTTPVTTRPLDEPEHLLVQVVLPGDLHPGSYAIHWGALDGDASLEKGMYLFNVVSKPTIIAPKIDEQTDASQRPAEAEEEE